MATYTRADLRDKVLSRLGKFDPLTPPSAEDAKSVEDEMQQKLEELHAEGLIPFNLDGDTIPGAYMIPLSYLVAGELVADYGAQAREQSIAFGAERGLRRLRILKAQPHYGAPVPVDYF